MTEFDLPPEAAPPGPRPNRCSLGRSLCNRCDALKDLFEITSGPSGEVLSAVGGSNLSVLT